MGTQMSTTLPSHYSESSFWFSRCKNCSHILLHHSTLADRHCTITNVVVGDFSSHHATILKIQKMIEVANRIFYRSRSSSSEVERWTLLPRSWLRICHSFTRWGTWSYVPDDDFYSVCV